jgi:hypothetical protein
MTQSIMTLDAEWHIFTDILEVFMLSVVATLQRVLFIIMTLGYFFSYFDYLEGCNDIQHNDTRC